MRYIWDETKNALNARKHGVTFAQAARIFERDVLGWPDERFDYGEERWIAIGFAEGKEIVVVYVEEEDCRRIISARYATRSERGLYWRATRR
jgi:uncharacterized DUF497 family protein